MTAWWAATIGLIALLAIYSAVSPKSIVQSTQRIFRPLAMLDAPRRVQISDVVPGDAESLAGRDLSFAATIKGLRDSESALVVWEDPSAMSLGESDTTQIALRAIASESSNWRANGYAASVRIPHHASGIQRYRIVAGDASAGPFELSIRDTPVVQVSQVHYTPPVYTGQKPRVRRAGSISAVDGTRVRIVADVNRSISRAIIELNPRLIGQEIRATAGASDLKISEDGRRVEHEFVLRHRDGKGTVALEDYRIRVWDDADQTNLEPIIYPIEIIQDLPPEISIVVPQTSPKDVPIDALQLFEIHASDVDYGLSEIEIEVRRGIDLIARAELWKSPVTESGQTPAGVLGKQVVEYRFRPSRMLTVHGGRLNVGDEVEVVAIATDNRHDENDPAIEPGVTKTTPVRLRIVAAADPNSESEDEQSGSAEKQPNATPPSKKGDGEQGQQGGSQGGESSESQQGSGEGGEPGQQGQGQQGEGEKGEGEQGDGEQGEGQQGDSESGPDDQAGDSEGNDSKSKGGNSSPNQDSGGNSGESGDNDGGQSEDGMEPSEDGSGEGGNSGAEGGNADDDTQAGRQDPSNSSSGGSPSSSSNSEQPPQDDAEAFERIKEYLENQKDAQDQNNATDQDQAGGEQSSGGDSSSNNTNQSGAEQSEGDSGEPGQAENAEGKQEPGMQGQGEGEQSQNQQEAGEQGPSDQGQSEQGQGEQGQGEQGQGEQQNGDQTQGDQQSAGENSEGSSGSSGDAGDQGDSGKSESSGDSGSQSDSSSGGESSSQASSSDDQQGSGENAEGEDEAGDSGGDGNSAENGARSGESQSGDANPDSSEASGESSGSSQTDPGSSSSNPSNPNSNGSPTPESSRGGGSGASGGGQGQEAGDDNSELPDPVDLDYTKKATDLVLDYLDETRQNPDPELLDRLKWTEQDLQRFQDRWKDVQPDEPNRNSDLPLSDEMRDALRSLGMRPPNSTKSSNRESADGIRGLRDAGNRRQAPPAIRDAFEAFRRGISPR